MPELYVVESAAARFDAMRDRLVAEWSRHDKMAQRLERELKKLDHRLEVRFIDPEAANNPNKDKAVGVVPARWHIIVRNPPGVMDAYFPIMGPNGELREPEMQVVEDMKEADLWRRGALQELRDRQIRDADAKARKQALEEEQRKDMMADAYRAAKRMPGDGGLTKSHSKKRKPKKLILPDEERP